MTSGSPPDAGTRPVLVGGGLSEAEAERRLRERGLQRRVPSSRSTWSIVRANVLTLFNAILAVAGAATLLLGDLRDALFLGILVGNTGIGIAQELRAKRELDRLAALVAPTATVVRGGRRRVVPVGDVLAGDLVHAGQGDQIVADGQLEPGQRLVLDESILSGESEGVARSGGEEVRSGSFVVEGSGTYTALAVGADSWAERVTGEARAFRHPRSPLERGLNRLLTVLVATMVPLGAILGIALASREGLQPGEVVATAVAALVSIVPEGLMLLASLTAAVAAIRMARRGALVQQLNGVESLASVDLICLDKTGTLTAAELRVEGVEPAPGVSEAELRCALADLAAATPDHNRTMHAVAQAFPRGSTRPPEQVVPFSSARRWSAVRSAGRSLLLGAPESFALDGEAAARVARATAGGRRVVALAESRAPLVDPGIDGAPPADARALGIVVLAERLRENAQATVRYLREEGIELLILSGDAPRTVAAIARDAGIAGDPSGVDGASLPSGDDELVDLLGRVSVVGRISPEGKRRVVRALAARERYVAMIGDGVNDVPALKAARLAIAQGSGAQMARSVADVVLVDGDFAAVPPMVHEGRTILRNVQRVARLFVTKSVFAAGLILAFAALGFDYPFLPRQLSLAATLTIGIPAFVLALAASSGPWRPDSIVRDIARFAVPAGIALTLGVVGAYLLDTGLLGRSTAEGRTVATTSLVAIGLGFVLLLEGSKRRGLAGWIVFAMALSYVVVLLIPGAREFFALTAPAPDELACAAAGSLAALGAFAPLWHRLAAADD